MNPVSIDLGNAGISWHLTGFNALIQFIQDIANGNYENTVLYLRVRFFQFKGQLFKIVPRLFGAIPASRVLTEPLLLIIKIAVFIPARPARVDVDAKIGAFTQS